jgi:predicted GIY-YIG superfamily endonuclease
MGKPIIGVYKISNTLYPEGKYYIGYSRNIMKRWEQHRYDLKTKRHGNVHLQRVYDKYGSECFTYEMLQECETEEEAIRVESSYLQDLSIRDKLYNLIFVNDKGLIYHSDESLMNMSQSQKESYTKGRVIANKRSIIINGITYPSINEASRQLGMIKSNIIYRLKSSKYTNYEYDGYDNEISEETRIKLSTSIKLRKPKPCNFKNISIDNIVYESVTDAARKLGVHRTTIYERIKSPNPKFANYFYADSKVLDDEPMPSLHLLLLGDTDNHEV